MASGYCSIRAQVFGTLRQEVATLRPKRKDKMGADVISLQYVVGWCSECMCVCVCERVFCKCRWALPCCHRVNWPQSPFSLRFSSSATNRPLLAFITDNASSLMVIQLRSSVYRAHKHTQICRVINILAHRIRLLMQCIFCFVSVATVLARLWAKLVDALLQYHSVPQEGLKYHCSEHAEQWKSAITEVLFYLMNQFNWIQ